MCHLCEERSYDGKRTAASPVHHGAGTQAESGPVKATEAKQNPLSGANGSDSVAVTGEGPSR